MKKLLSFVSVIALVALSSFTPEVRYKNRVAIDQCYWKTPTMCVCCYFTGGGIVTCKNMGNPKGGCKL